MKSRPFGTIAVLALLGIIYLTMAAGVTAADAVQPAGYSGLINARGEDVVSATGTYYRGTSLCFTNSHTLVGGAGSDTQGLDGVTVEFRVGTSSSNIAYTGTVYAVGGVTNRYWVTIEVPSLTGTINLQTKLTDSVSTNVFIYPWKRLNTTAPLE